MWRIDSTPLACVLSSLSPAPYCPHFHNCESTNKVISGSSLWARGRRTWPGCIWAADMYRHFFVIEPHLGETTHMQPGSELCVQSCLCGKLLIVCRFITWPGISCSSLWSFPSFRCSDTLVSFAPPPPPWLENSWTNSKYSTYLNFKHNIRKNRQTTK